MIDMALEPCLQIDGPGIFGQKVSVVVKRFFIEHRDTWTSSKWKYNSKMAGFRGENFAFGLSVRQYDEMAPESDAMAVSLLFKTVTDIKIRVEWSASIVRPSGEVLASSVISCVEFEEDEATEFCREDDLEDDVFTSRQQIREKNLLSGDDLHVVADIRFKILEGGNAEASRAFQPLLEALKHQLDSPIFSDLTIVSAGGTEIKTHKLILALSSPVFRAMLENDLEEARTGVIKIEDAKTESIKAMLAYLVGVEPQEWTFDLTKSLLELADKYDLKGLGERAANEMGKLISMGSLADVLLLAHRHSFKSLLAEAFVFLEDNIGQATANGVLVRLLPENESQALFREWQAHWSRRKNEVAPGEGDKDDNWDEEESSDEDL